MVARKLSVLVHLMDYQLVRRDRKTRGSSVCWYFRQAKYRIIDVGFLNVSYLEQLWLHNKRNIAVAVAYRHPSSPVFGLLELETVLQYMYLMYNELALVVDLNVDILSRNHPNACQLSNILYQLNLIQIITEPTRHTTNSAILIDIMCVDNTINVTQCRNVDVSDETDQMIAFYELDLASMETSNSYS